MPNWTWNKIVCKKQLLDKIVDKNKDGYFLDFNKLIPMPESLDLDAGSIELKSVASYYISLNKTDRYELYKLLKKTKLEFYGSYWDKYKNFIKDLRSNPNKIEETKKMFEEDYKSHFENINSLNELGKLYVSNIYNYGNSDWYDWRYKYWGTKWNVLEKVDVKYNKSLKEYEVTFDTAWSPPYGIIYEYSQLCDEKDFYWEYQNEGDDEVYSFSKKDDMLVRKRLDNKKEKLEDEMEL